MTYRITEGGMLDGVMRQGGELVADDVVIGLANFEALTNTGYLTRVDDEAEADVPEPDKEPAAMRVPNRPRQRKR